ncbi:MAG: peptidoglycan editing factor PgeF [Alphaproteobacteria bacterium]|nr:peptidoglycan editing factor PgeF [Alphaproteobacteria bacterium]
MPRLTTGVLNRIEGVRHAFFTRNGGVSQGIYASSNCGFGSRDAAAAVAENRARAMRRIDADPAKLVTLSQVHSADVVEVAAPWRRGDAPRADAMVTRVPGIVLGILTADCAPVLFADAEARVVGAAHAGWRGALSGVLEATVAAMCRMGASPRGIVAAIGPAIGRASYEVGPEFPAPFLAQDASNSAFFFPAETPSRHLFDLKGYAAARLAAAGLSEVAVLPNDTRMENRRFFSYRRACLRGEPNYGRQLSAILVEE